MARSAGWMRKLDRTGGAAVLQLLAIGLRRKALPEKAERIGVIMPSAVGDTMLGSGFFASVLDRYPQAEIFVFHAASNAAAVRMLPIKVTGIRCNFTNPAATVSAMRKQKLDIAVDMTPWTKLTAIYARLAAPVAIGFDPPGLNRDKALDIAVKHDPTSHEMDNIAGLAAIFSPRPYQPKVVTQSYDNADGLDLGRLVLCHVVAGGTEAERKSWPLERWAELTRRLVADGWQVGFTGVAGDSEKIGRIMADAALPEDKVISLCGRISLEKLGDLLKRARLLITIDTGVLHLAAAVGGRVLALHGPTRSSRWGARGEKVRSLDSSHPASGYVIYGYESEARGAEIMKCHSVDDVASAAIEMLHEDEPVANYATSDAPGMQG